jgi:putative CocE/NonD family hydrolase
MGKNTWKESATFPPASANQEQALYLRSDMSLSDEVGIAAQALSFTYDPNDPSPTVGGKTLSPDLDQGPYDQAIVESRNDNLVFTTATLTQDLVVEGQITAHVFISSDRPDTDVFLRITEVYPDGRSIALGQIGHRLRFRDGYTTGDEAFMMPGEVYEVELKFDHLAHTFTSGNKVRIIVTSSNYIWFNRNMNNGDEMYPSDNLDTLVSPMVATNMIHMQGQYPSRMVIPNSGTATTVNPGFALSGVDLYPNPASDQVELRNVDAGARIEIFSINGKRLVAFTTQRHSERIQLSDLDSGVYTVVIYAGTDTRYPQKVNSVSRLVISR